MELSTGFLIGVFLLYLRVLSFIMLVPVFGTFFVPGFVRIYLAFAIALSIALFVPIKPIETTSALEIFRLALSEVLFGFIAGFLLRLIFDTIFVAGEVTAVHSGLGFLMMFLPQQPQTTVIAGFSALLGSALFLTLGGAESVLLGLAGSIKNFPLGSFDPLSLRGDVFLELFYKSFSMGIKIAVPVLISALLTNIILAVVNRFIPQINVFMVGLPLQIAVGLIVFMLSLPVMGIVLISYMREHILNFVRFINAL